MVTNMWIIFGGKINEEMWVTSVEVGEIHWCLLLGYDREDLWCRLSEVIKQAGQLLL